MKKQFGKPNTLIGLEDGDYSNKKHSLTTLIHTEHGKINGQKNAAKSGYMSRIGILGGKLTGKKLGKLAVESGQLNSLKTPEHQSKAGKSGGTTTKNKVQTCPWCFKTIKGLNYNRWHGNNCKFAW